jgi:hypothetical protein
MMSWWTIVAVVAVVALLAAHARLYAWPPDGGVILQAPLASVTPDLLAERRPLVIEDGVVDPRDLLTTVLRWQTCWHSDVEACPAGVEARTDARFTALYFAAASDAQQQEQQQEQSPAVVIEQRSRPGQETAVLLHDARVLLLPPGYRYRPLSTALRIRAHDPFTVLLSAASILMKPPSDRKIKQ